jgi:tRNA(Ile)-lysidine synthetase-like protein
MEFAFNTLGQHLKTSSMMMEMPKKIAVGWSGGVDSTALLLALRECGHDVYAWHIDHAWHKHSADDAEQLRYKAEQWDIPFATYRLEKSYTNNREAQARRGRYQAFQRLAQKTKIKSIALGHHADDQAETVCMRMLQGAGVKGCRGMRALSYQGDLRIYRPLLHIGKKELSAVLEKAGVSCLEDKSNHDISLWRNHIRLNFFPALKVAGVSPRSFFERWQAQAVRLSAMIEEDLEAIHFTHRANMCSLNWNAWQELSQPVRAAALQCMAGLALGEGVVFGRRHIELIDFWQQKGGRGGLDLSGCRLEKRCGCLHLEAKKASSCT